MAEHYDPDADESENLGARHGRRRGPQYAPTINLRLPAGLGNGNFKWVVIFLLGILGSTFAYLWATKDKHDENSDGRLISLEKWRERADERMDWMQREFEQSRK